METKMKLLIDADGCPVVNIAVKIGGKHRLQCVIVCDTSHIFQNDYAEIITVSKGTDSVDFTLVNMVESGDIVITQDYGLAAMCLVRKAVVINQNGMSYNSGNIDLLLHSRYIIRKICRSGGRVKGPSKRTVEQDKAFEMKLQELLCHCQQDVFL